MRNNMLMAAAKRADAAGAVALDDTPSVAAEATPTPEPPTKPVAAPKARPEALAPTPAPAPAAEPPRPTGTVEDRLRETQTRMVNGVKVMEPTERLVPTVHLAVRIPKPTHSAIRTWATRVDMSIQDFVLSAVDELMQRLAAADEQS